jgi:hypothetical protein
MSSASQIISVKLLLQVCLYCALLLIYLIGSVSVFFSVSSSLVVGQGEGEEVVSGVSAGLCC